MDGEHGRHHVSVGRWMLVKDMEQKNNKTKEDVQKSRLG